jgi:hypothetical protein
MSAARWRARGHTSDPATSVVLHAVRDLRKPMDLRLWLGASRNDAQRHREDLQRRHGRKDAAFVSRLECNTTLG